MKPSAICLIVAAGLLAGCGSPLGGVRDRSREKTASQSNSLWKPVTDNHTDVAFVYGTCDSPEMSL